MPRQHYCPRVARKIHKNCENTTINRKKVAINRQKMTENVLKIACCVASVRAVAERNNETSREWRAKSLKTTGAQGFLSAVFAGFV